MEYPHQNICGGGSSTPKTRRLLKTEENKHVEIHEVSGFLSDDLMGTMWPSNSSSKIALSCQRVFGIRSSAIRAISRWTNGNKPSAGARAAWILNGELARKEGNVVVRAAALKTQQLQ